ncbi:MAG TPA: glycine cleavage T C-terminal barrel domain-containing protein [Bryobacteraceae bacterium]|jgi:folate-binding protein YgfZ|nr:glycine cleavage T C-terminal barrel domain-containing protein [Bryobacteraceae bacterium]
MSSGYELLRHAAGLLDLTARGRIVARGRDRARLLHNLTSNEVKKMTPGSACYAFLLSPQGRIQADLYLLCFEDHFLIDTEPELREKVLQHIKRYIIADQVELEDVSESTACLGIEGPGAAAVLAGAGASVPGDYAHLAWNSATIAGITLTGQPGVRIYSPQADSAAVSTKLEAAGAKPVTMEDARIVRVENGKPRYGEGISDRSLPQETQQMHAISFTKGCYLGQEIVERIRAQGHVNKKLVRLEIAAKQPPAAAAKAESNGDAAGEIVSAVYSPQSGAVAALAYLRTQFAEPGAKVQVEGHDARVLG